MLQKSPDGRKIHNDIQQVPKVVWQPTKSLKTTRNKIIVCFNGKFYFEFEGIYLYRTQKKRNFSKYTFLSDVGFIESVLPINYFWFHSFSLFRLITFVVCTFLSLYICSSTSGTSLLILKTPGAYCCMGLGVYGGCIFFAPGAFICQLWIF